MRKFLMVAALTLYASTAAQGQDVIGAITEAQNRPIDPAGRVMRVNGTVSQVHIGRILSCFAVNGQWFAIPTLPDTEYNYVTQSTAMLLAAQSRQPISFLANQDIVITCHGGPQAFLARDIDRVYQ